MSDPQGDLTKLASSRQCCPVLPSAKPFPLSLSLYGKADSPNSMTLCDHAQKGGAAELQCAKERSHEA